MKIHIIGGSGTGKSYIANKLSLQYNIPHYDLDEIFWDNASNSYGTKMPVEKRAKKLREFLDGDSWIIEGVFYAWLSESFSAADMVFVIRSPQIVCNLRIVRRFIKRKLGFQKGKSETLKSLYELIVWTRNYQKNTIPNILEMLNEYSKKVVIVHSSNEILKHLRTAV